MTGIGVVEKKVEVVVANDATVKGGSYFPLTVAAHLRAQEVAEQNGPLCVPTSSTWRRFPALQAEVFPDREHLGRIFYNQAHVREGHPADRGCRLRARPAAPTCLR